jgi:hypothetical protein
MRQDRLTDTPTLQARNYRMARIVSIAIVLCALLMGGCNSGDKPTDTSDHLLKEHKRALDKAKEVDRLAREAADRQRKSLE